MKSTQIVAGALAVALAAFLPLAASAAEVGVGVSGNVTGVMHAGDEMMEASSSMGVGVSASTSVENGKGMEVNEHAMAGQETAEYARENNGAMVTLMKNAVGVTVTTPAQVSSDEDLQTYAHNVRANDARVASVNAAAADKVEVAYEHRAYLFGFIPVTATTWTVVSANASGSAKAVTSYPWWNFLASGDAGVAAKVDASLASDTAVEAVAKGSASASAKAAAIAAIIAAHASASASASAGAQ